MEKVFLVIQIILALSLIGIILVQKSSTDGLSGLSGGNSGFNVIGSRASANILTKLTSLLALFFIVNSIVLSNITSRGNDKAVKIVESIQKKVTVPSGPKEITVPKTQ